MDWKEYCLRWQRANPEWMDVIHKHKKLLSCHGTDAERAALDRDLEPLRPANDLYMGEMGS